ncbi:thiamine phosphate synthase [Methylobacterium sp. Leaf108]|uniref:thiamine phosphate synthase n=1 Tax=Methylobacterium sp. Leaf108 TaxID=1736256 RepID=UPI00070035BC|nr:thiamine phosphate synthase [Methylobacterium sp. Leaf108]KQP56264.1 thiamine monophosphate synthase [Methylobacterium sp. Leaf108]
MTAPRTRLALLTPHRVEASHVDGLVAAIRRATAAADVAAVVLRLAPADERSLVNLVKRLAPGVQEAGAAVLVACAGYDGDLVSVAARGGADGVHLDKPGEGDLRDLRGRLADGRILGARGGESKHAAMEAGEAGVDYVMFGGLYPDGVAPDAELVLARTQWWTEIFETPCIAVAQEIGQVAALAATGTEFVGIEGGLWLDASADLGAIMAVLAEQAALRDAAS